MLYIINGGDRVRLYEVQLNPVISIYSFIHAILQLFIIRYSPLTSASIPHIMWYEMWDEMCY